MFTFQHCLLMSIIITNKIYYSWVQASSIMLQVSIHRLPKICHLVLSNHVVLGIHIFLVPSGLVKINYIASGKYKCGMLFQTPSVKVSLPRRMINFADNQHETYDSKMVKMCVICVPH
jgi:hypothetical protein